MSNVKENFLRYVQIETTSSETSGTCPSTPNQWVLAKMLVDELHAMGIDNARVDDHCYVYATIPAKGNHPAKVGLISHMDTSDGVKGPTHPVIIEHYDGSAITLKNGVVIDGFPFLKDLQGQELIVTSGDSVLGADDKAGVAEIMALCKRLTAPDAPEHCTVCIGFTPDEEIGSGADHFDVAGFGADYAYTVDGGALGELEYENFNACSASFDIHGVSVHPGSSKDTMVNACLLAMEINSLLPLHETPRDTEGYEGFYHLIQMSGDCGHATLNYIVRDHDTDNFQRRKDKLADITNELNKKWGENTVELHIKDQYYNMKNIIEEHMHLIDNAKLACERTGLTPIVSPIRGGTDGCQLSFRGLPCPDIGTGGHGYHGPYEHISVQSMDKVVDMMIELVKIYSTFSV